MADIKTMFANMNESGGGDAAPAAATKKPAAKKGTIEKTYQKKSQLEHILLRPDTYIGSVEKVKENMWIYSTEKECMIQKEIEYVPGLYKIFDEILVNAADNKQRDKHMDCIKITIDAESNTISVWNNGKGIPVVMHKEENMYVPTMIFGHLLTSSNYDDEEEKVTGGRNGYGAKLCNIFSTKFTVETASKDYKKQYKQTWGSNMTKTSDSKIKEFIGTDYTKVTFSPDLSKFKMEKLDDDIVGLMSRRAYDIAASSRGVKVFLNGEKLSVKNFKDYIDLYIKQKEDESGNGLKIVYEHASDRWEIALTMSDTGFQQVSFVNSIATTKGGRHVDYVTDMIVKQLIEVLKKKNKGGIQIKPFQIKNHLWIFVNCLIVNPTFDSQTKENMTLQAKSFGSKCALSEKFIAAVIKSGIVETVLSWAKFKAQDVLNKKTSGKKMSKLKGIPKLEDANEAGTKNGLKCTLILTEGDSAKTLAVSGLGVIGRDYYGVFPLRGKLLNVREATHKQILENAEINNLIKILGLQYKKKYNSEDDMKSLRYGKVMIMTDQDQDGSHIKGLLINFIHYNWPELLKQSFLEEFITPIVKATKKNESLSFYSLPEFDEWKANTPNHHTYGVKYYKGLGTSTSKEAKEYFTDIARHRIRFRYNGQTDDDHILLAFSKKHIEGRKEWLTNFMVESRRRKEFGLAEKYLYAKDTRFVSYTDFVNLELVLFSNADNVRSIPCLVDGVKPGQRKVLFACMKRNDKKEVKVAQLAGSVAYLSAYHHGEVSLCMTIVNLAQNFVGSNNINLLEPRGQFGTRLTGGKDSASPRYIFTKMSPLTRLIFHPHDDPLLKAEYDDNKRIEPVWYIPIIPMILINGADGIGTGWMTKIPNYNPRELVQCIRAMLDNGGERPASMNQHLMPHYKNFKGTMDDIGEGRYLSSGEISIIGHEKLEITELPVGTWTQKYKEDILEPLLHGSDKIKGVLSDYKEYNTDTTVKFIITCNPGELANLEKDGLHKTFKLQSMINTSSMCVFDELGCLRRFESVMDILVEYYALRVKMYQKRKDYLEGMLGAEVQKLSNQARFIMEKCNGQLVVENKKRKTIVDELVKKGYDPDPVIEWKARSKIEEDEDEDGDGPEEEEDGSTTSKSKPVDPEKTFKNLTEVKKFDYLLGMSMWMLTDEKKAELLRQRDVKQTELDVLKKKTNTDLWREDLDVFEQKLNEIEEKERLDEVGLTKKDKKAPVGRKKLNHFETMPSPSGKRIVPIIGEDIKKKVQQAAKAKDSKTKKVKKELADEEEVDEFDAMLQNKGTLADKLGTPEGAAAKGKAKGVQKKAKDAAKDGLKQTKLNFTATAKTNGKKAAPARRGGKANSGSESDFEHSGGSGSDSDVGQARSGGGNSSAGGNNTSTSSPSRARRATVKKVVYALNSDDEEDVNGGGGDDDEEELFDNVAIKEPVMVESMEIADSSSDEEERRQRMLKERDEKGVVPDNKSADLFDSLLNSSKDDEPLVTKPKEKAPPKRKRPIISATSDSEDGGKKKTKAKPKAKKAARDDSSSDEFTFPSAKAKISDSDSEEIMPVKRGGGRAKKVTKYKVDDSDSD